MAPLLALQHAVNAGWAWGDAGLSAWPFFTPQLLVIAVLLVVSVLHLLVERSRTNAVGAFEMPIIGSVEFLWSFVRRGMVLDGLLHASAKSQWKTFTLKWLGERRFIFTTDPANVEYILKSNFDNFPKGQQFHDYLTSLLGDGIFVADGQTWKLHRKLASHMFSANNFRDTIMKAIIKHGRELQAVLDDACPQQPKGNADQGDVCFSPHSPSEAARPPSAVPHNPPPPAVNMFKLLNAFTLDSIGDIAFGCNIGSLRDPSGAFATAFDNAQAILDLRFFTPYWRLWRALGLSSAEKQLERCVAVMDAFCASVISARRAEEAGCPPSSTDVHVAHTDGSGVQHHYKAVSSEGSSGSGYNSKGDVLTRFMRVSARDVERCSQDALASPASSTGSSSDSEQDRPLYGQDTPEANRVLRDVLCNFLIAGRDTTAQASSWAVYELTRHPEVAAKVAQEAHALEAMLLARAAGSSSGTVPAGDFLLFSATYDDLVACLPYSRAVMHEVLRLHPSVPKDAKQAVQDDVLPDGTRVPAGCWVSYLPHAMGRRPDLWPEPASFIPERFLASSGHPYYRRDNLSPYKFIAFNAGPRTCLGQPMALLESSFLLALLCRRYDIRLCEDRGKTGGSGGQGREVTYQDSLTLPIKGGLWVTVQRRAGGT